MLCVWTIIVAAATSGHSIKHFTNTCHTTYTYLIIYTAIFLAYCLLSVVGYLWFYRYAKRHAVYYKEWNMWLLEDTNYFSDKPRKMARGQRDTSISVSEISVNAHKQEQRTQQQAQQATLDSLATSVRATNNTNETSQEFEIKTENSGMHMNDESVTDESVGGRKASSVVAVYETKEETGGLDEMNKKLFSREIENKVLNKKMLTFFIIFICIYGLMAIASVYPLYYFWSSYHCRVEIIDINYALWLVGDLVTVLNLLFFFVMFQILTRILVRSSELMFVALLMGLVDGLMLAFGSLFCKYLYLYTNGLQRNLAGVFGANNGNYWSCHSFLYLPVAIVMLLSLKHLLSIAAFLFYQCNKEQAHQFNRCVEALNWIVKCLNFIIFVLIVVSCIVAFIPCNDYIDDKIESKTIDHYESLMYEYARRIVKAGIGWNVVNILVQLFAMVINKFFLSRISDYRVIALKPMVLIHGIPTVLIHGFWGILFAITDRNRLYRIYKKDKHHESRAWIED